MSITQGVMVVYDPVREQWMLLQGRETFYDEERYMRTWDTREEAKAWAIENLGVDPDEYWESRKLHQEQGEQMRLM